MVIAYTTVMAVLLSDVVDRTYISVEYNSRLSLQICVLNNIDARPDTTGARVEDKTTQVKQKNPGLFYKTVAMPLLNPNHYTGSDKTKAKQTDCCNAQFVSLPSLQPIVYDYEPYSCSPPIEWYQTPNGRSSLNHVYTLIHNLWKL